jgi:glycosyltransferase involved in cell wall biosynthesis
VDKIICVSEATKKFSVEKRGISAAKLITIPYGVDLAKYRLDKNSKKKTDLALKANDIVVGTVARLHPQKGHQYLITAAAEVVERYPNVRFVFVGDGILRAELERLVDNLKLKDKILFLGFRHDVDELLHTFDIFVLPSLYEGLPNVVLEAMACGKPVIATAVDGSPEAITDGVSGILVPPKDSDALSKAILHLLENKKMRVEMGKKSRKKVTDYFSLEKQMQQFQILYDHHLQQKM